MCLKFKEKITNPLAQINLIDDDFGITLELFLLLATSKGSLWCFGIFFLFLKKIEKEIHNMFF